jgi:hypothetical protein
MCFVLLLGTILIKKVLQSQGGWDENRQSSNFWSGFTLMTEEEIKRLGWMKKERDFRHQIWQILLKRVVHSILLWGPNNRKFEINYQKNTISQSRKEKIRGPREKCKRKRVQKDIPNFLDYSKIRFLPVNGKYHFRFRDMNGKPARSDTAWQQQA